MCPVRLLYVALVIGYVTHECHLLPAPKPTKAAAVRHPIKADMMLYDMGSQSVLPVNFVAIQALPASATAHGDVTRQHVYLKKYKVAPTLSSCSY